MNIPDYIYTYELNPVEEVKDRVNDKEEVRDDKMCRICYDETDEPLIAPCKCSGSIKWVHESCLKKWIESSNKEICPQCNVEYKKKTTYKYPSLQFMAKPLVLSGITIAMILIGIGVGIGYSVKYTRGFYIKSLSNLFHLYNGTKGFLYVSIFAITFLHISKIINVFNIVSDQNIYMSSINSVELMCCIYKVYREITKNIIYSIILPNLKYTNIK